MQIRESSQGYIIALDPGEELVCSLTSFARQYDVDFAPHVHAVLGRPDFTTVGGLVHQAVCGESVEMLVQPPSELVHSLAQQQSYWQSKRVEADA